MQNIPHQGSKKQSIEQNGPRRIFSHAINTENRIDEAVKSEYGIFGYTHHYSRLKLEAQEKQKKELDEQLFRTQKVEAIGRLTGGIAHDLNNLLSPILGYGQLLLFDCNVSGLQREKLEQIIKAGNGARELVQRLLAFNRKQVIEYKPVDLNVILSDFLKLLERTIPEKIEIKLIQFSSIPHIMADKGQIEQAIMNLYRICCLSLAAHLIRRKAFNRHSN